MNTFAETFQHYKCGQEVLCHSQLTIRGNLYNLGHLVRFCESRGIEHVQNLSSDLLIEFRHWIYYTPSKTGVVRSLRTQNRILESLKSFCRFLKNEGYLSFDPASSIEYARKPRRLPRMILTVQEARKIIESIDTGNPYGYRDRTIMEVFYATGIRRLELAGLRLGDVNLEEELLRINEGKGGHDRVVPLGGKACRFLETYIKAIRPALCRKPTDRLFISRKGNPISIGAIGELVKRHAKLARIKKNVTPHVWRHTCATHLVKNRANLRHVQQLLGHRSLATTELYLNLTINDLKEAHRRCHPRERSKEN